MLRPIIQIDEAKCNGCGQCITDCAEGALAIVNGKARVISDSYCDGLGACLNCPQGALTLEMRDVAPFDEAAALAAKAAREKATPKPLEPIGLARKGPGAELPSWPIQLELIPAGAKFLQNAHVLLAAHCSAFSLPQFQQDWLQGKIPVIACPKLQNNQKLIEKLRDAIKDRQIAGITVLRMSVPCCAGLERIAREAVAQAGLDVPVDVQVVQLG